MLQLEKQNCAPGDLPQSADLAGVWRSRIRGWLPDPGSSEKRKHVCSLLLGRSGDTHPAGYKDSRDRTHGCLRVSVTDEEQLTSGCLLGSPEGSEDIT